MEPPKSSRYKSHLPGSSVRKTATFRVFRVQTAFFVRSEHDEGELLCEPHNIMLTTTFVEAVEDIALVFSFKFEADW